MFQIPKTQINQFKVNPVAYFCLEFGLESDLRTYAGGLGILAGDTAKAATDAGVPFIGISLLYHGGYFKQTIDQLKNVQIESTDTNDFRKYLELTDFKLKIQLKGQEINAIVWKYNLNGNGVYFIDTNIVENNDFYRSISDQLYSTSSQIRTYQELVLGFGGLELVKILGGQNLWKNYTIHLNESNAAFALVGLFREGLGLEEIKNNLLFSTHTPILAGHKVYQISDLIPYFEEKELDYIRSFSKDNGSTLNLTLFCLDHAGFTNGVAKRHMEVSQNMYPGHKINFITNGIHSSTWVGSRKGVLFDKYLPGWRGDTTLLRGCYNINNFELENAHLESKEDLKAMILETTGHDNFQTHTFTIGFARRIDPYKRHDFIVRNLPRLQQLAAKFDGLQLVIAGKAYPGNGGEDSVLNSLLEKMAQNGSPQLKIYFIPDYSMDISRIMVSGSDLWLNNPIKPLEACGTSGMKAQLNGVPNISTLDGWWVEGHLEDVTGWSIGDSVPGTNERAEQDELFWKLEYNILPTFYTDSAKWIRIMKNCIALNGVYFSAQRMVNEYYKGAK